MQFLMKINNYNIKLRIKLLLNEFKVLKHIINE